MAQQHERLARAARDRGIRDLERVRLNPTRVVALDGHLGDLITVVGKQLLAGRGELGKVTRERSH